MPSNQRDTEPERECGRYEMPAVGAMCPRDPNRRRAEDSEHGEEAQLYIYLYILHSI